MNLTSTPIKIFQRFILVFSVILIISGCGIQQTEPTHHPETSLETTIISNSEEQDSSLAHDSDAEDVQETSPPSSETEESQVTTASVGIPAGELIVHFINVGQGSSQLLIGPTGKTMLIDAGNNDKEQLMVEYLKKEKIERIDILIGTHPDADHIGGLDAVIDNFDIGKIYMPKSQANTKTFEDVLLAIQRKGLKVTTAKAGIDLEWEENVHARMIAPINDYKDTNEMSAVLHITYGTTSFLMTGDAESKSEADMLASNVDLAADVLLVGHHGSHTSTSEAFLHKINPKYGVIQVGEDNKYGHPAADVLSRLKDKDVTIYRNDEQGNIIFLSDGKEISVSTNDWKPVDERKLPSQTPTEQPKQTPAPSVENVQDSTEEIRAKASISNAAPKQNESVTVTVTVVNANGKPVKGAQVDLSLAYKSTTSNYDGVTDSDGKAEISFRIGRASLGFTVNGSIDVTHSDKKATAKTSFTPQ